MALLHLLLGRVDSLALHSPLKHTPFTPLHNEQKNRHDIERTEGKKERKKEEKERIILIVMERKKLNEIKTGK